MVTPPQPLGYDAVARLLAGDAALQERPDRLQHMAWSLERAAETWVAPRHRSERQVLKLHRARMKRRLGTVEEAAEILARELADPILRVFIDNARARPMMAPGGRRLARVLMELQDRAATARAAIRPRRGNADSQSPFLAPTAAEVGAQQIAALVILSGWEVFHGRPAGLDNQTAQAAAATYWTTATGSSETGWRHHFSEARELQKLGAPDDLFGLRRADPRARLVAEIVSTIRSPGILAEA